MKSNKKFHKLEFKIFLKIDDVTQDDVIKHFNFFRPALTEKQAIYSDSSWKSTLENGIICDDEFFCHFMGIFVFLMTSSDGGKFLKIENILIVFLKTL